MPAQRPDPDELLVQVKAEEARARRGRLRIFFGATAGVGKTALAVQWAHRVAAQFPDGQLYVNLRGFDPGGAPLAAAEAVRRLLDALGVAPQRVQLASHS